MTDNLHSTSADELDKVVNNCYLEIIENWDKLNDTQKTTIRLEISKQAKERLTAWHEAELAKARIDPFDYVAPCEPDCTPERHAYHQGQWDMAERINIARGLEPHP